MNLIERLKVNEGTVKAKGLHVPYKDSEGYLTIGYGILIDPAKGGGLYEDEAEYLLRNRANKALTAAANYPYFSNLNENRQSVLVEMIYNMGKSRVDGFKKMHAALFVGDYEDAAKEMLGSRWARQVKGRADRLAEIMRTG